MRLDKLTEIPSYILSSVVNAALRDNRMIMMMMIDAYGHFCVHGRLNGLSDLQR